MKITKENFNNLDLFLKDNLCEFNTDPKPFEYNTLSKNWPKEFGNDVISATDIRKRLNENYKSLLDDLNLRSRFEEKISNMKSTTKEAAKKEFLDIAVDYCLNIKDVECHYNNMIKQAMLKGYLEDQSIWQEDIVARLLHYANRVSSLDTGLPKKYIKNDFSKTFSQSMYWMLNMGFGQNLTNEIKGQDVANAGDSAQLFFVGRAILAGFNCSNVDVRSSSYDAIISRPNSTGSASNLKTVQIKGIKPGSYLSLIKRARGGSGSDPSSGRNVARVLSSKEADLLAAVDKKFGTCYIIPMCIVDDKVKNGINRISWGELEEKYKENWNII